MPIRINLLAEAQAAEEMRRRDPVKRAIYAGVILVAGMLTWASLLQARIALQKSEVASLESTMESISDDYDAVVGTQKELTSTRNKLLALNRLSTNRFLSGNLLNALQQAVVPDVRLVKLSTSFDYAHTEAVKPKTNSTGKVLDPGKPATSKERIVVSLQAEDACGLPGDKVDLYKQTIASLPHFQNLWKNSEDGVRLIGLNPPETDPDGRKFVAFTLQCPYPEIVR
jgi:hypothetical protein